MRFSTPQVVPTGTMAARPQPTIVVDEESAIRPWHHGDAAGVVEWAFTTLGMHRLQLDHSVQNATSCRVAASLGFTAEGTLRSARHHPDGWHDMHLHARIAPDPEG